MAGKTREHHKNSGGPAETPPRRPVKYVPRKPPRIPRTRHPATGGRRRHTPQ